MEKIIAILTSQFKGVFYPEHNSYSGASNEAIYTLRCNSKDLIVHSPTEFEIYPVNELVCVDGHIYHNGVCIA